MLVQAKDAPGPAPDQGAPADGDNKQAKDPKKVRRSGKGKKGGGASKPKVKKAEMGRQVAAELHKLRPLLKEIAANLTDRLDGQLAGLALFLEGEAMPEEVAILPNSRLLAAMLAQIKALRIKPKKGRVKDLARIEALLEGLSAKVPPGS